MVFISIGVLGFVLLMIADVFCMKERRVLGGVASFLGTLSVFVSSIFILIYGDTYIVPLTVKIVFGIFTFTFLALMIYSILIEVRKNKNKEDNLVTTGTYALTRHPGVLWFLLYYVFGSVLFGNVDILIAGLIWTVANIIYVYLQEKLVFYKIFKNYDKYVMTTPMLLPNIKSIRRFINTINGGQNERFTSDA